MSAADDQADVDRVLAGDVAAFEPIVRRWQGPLINLAYRFCHDRGRAEDLAQEAFLRAFRGLPHWRRQGAFSTWLFAVATNHYRSELKRIPPTVPLGAVAEPQAAAGGHPHSGDRDRGIRQAVSTLPLKYREVLVLFYFHGMDITAAARSLDLPEGTVKARLSRAREILRVKLSRVLSGHLSWRRSS